MMISRPEPTNAREALLGRCAQRGVGLDRDDLGTLGQVVVRVVAVVHSDVVDDRHSPPSLTSRRSDADARPSIEVERGTAGERAAGDRARSPIRQGGDALATRGELLDRLAPCRAGQTRAGP